MIARRSAPILENSLKHQADGLSGAKGLKVVAECEFIKGWIDKHPDYADLLQA